MHVQCTLLKKTLYTNLLVVTDVKCSFYFICLLPFKFMNI